MPSARVYLPSLLALLGAVRGAGWHHVYLAPCHRHGINWFARTILQWDGLHMFAEVPRSNNEYSVIIGDACPLGGGCFTDAEFVLVRWCRLCSADGASGSQSLEIANALICVSTFGRHFILKRQARVRVWTQSKPSCAKLLRRSSGTTTRLSQCCCFVRCW